LKQEIRLGFDFSQLQPYLLDKFRGMKQCEGDFPWVLEGTSDELEKTPPGFREFLKDMAGDVTYTVKWKLDRKGR
jgi:hypothetical protein